LPKAESFAVAVLGEIAHSILRGDSNGAVLAVFRRSFYIQFGNDVICIGSVGLGKGPLNALAVVPDGLEWPSLGLAPRQDVFLRSTTALSVGDYLRFDFDGADLWRPPAAPTYSLDDLRTGLRVLASSVRRRLPGGLGAVLTALDEPSLWSSLQAEPLLRAAHGTMTDIGRWLGKALAGSADAAPAVENLIALGPGLTPSGDDFFCGVLAALNYFGHGDVAKRLAADVLPVAARETSLISAAYLRCAAQGQASAVLFDVLESLLTGCGELEARLDVIHAVGHTSGWDSLAGAATVCAALLAQQSATPPSASVND
jgi:Protein of unknown function (DUF2877)